ncbi:MAG: NERD domain-containing protein [Prosthecobacter sp.]|jgi:hypothetical protein|nr:NERD domain-containing protein [Prosthecobacter sp.]
MLNKIIDKTISFVSAHWHIVFVLCLCALVVSIFVAVRQFGGKKKPSSAGRSRSSSTRQNTAASCLKRLPQDIYHVFQELYVPRLDGNGVTRITYVVAARHGIFVVHPQRDLGRISGNPTDRVWTAFDGGRESTFSNPVIRNAYHARALARHLGLPEALICPVVYFDQEVNFDQKPPANVLTSGLHNFILSHKAELLTEEMLTKLLAKLRETARDEKARLEYDTYRRSKGRRVRRTKES